MTGRGVECEVGCTSGGWMGGVGDQYIRGENDDTGEGLYSIHADQSTLTAGCRALQEKLVAGARTRCVGEQDRFVEEDTRAHQHASGYTAVDLFSEYQAT